MKSHLICRGDGIFVDNGKRRAIHHILYPQLLTKRSDKGGFTRTHRSIKRKNSPPLGEIKQSTSRGAQVL